MVDIVHVISPEGKPLIEQGRDREEFADFYRYASERGTLFYTPGAQIAKKRPVQACTGPVTYVGGSELKKEIDVTVANASGAGDDTIWGDIAWSRASSSSVSGSKSFWAGAESVSNSRSIFSKSTRSCAAC